MISSMVSFLLRIGLGLTFFLAGLEKSLDGVDGVVAFFTDAGIPAPEIMAPFVTYLELIGGVGLLIGLGTVAFGVLFVAEMLVAILVVRLPAALEVGSVAPGFATVRLEIMLILTAVCLVLLGPGRWSLDAALRIRWPWQSTTQS